MNNSSVTSKYQILSAFSAACRVFSDFNFQLILSKKSSTVILSSMQDMLTIIRHDLIIKEKELVYTQHDSI